MSRVTAAQRQPRRARSSRRSRHCHAAPDTPTVAPSLRAQPPPPTPRARPVLGPPACNRTHAHSTETHAHTTIRSNKSRPCSCIAAAKQTRPTHCFVLPSSSSTGEGGRVPILRPAHDDQAALTNQRGTTSPPCPPPPASSLRRTDRIADYRRGSMISLSFQRIESLSQAGSAVHPQNHCYFINVAR